VKCGSLVWVKREVFDPYTCGKLCHKWLGPYVVEVAIGFRRLPFGLSCSPAIFSRQMREILGPLIKKGVKNYLDDVIVFANSFEELVLLLESFFEHLQEKGVKLNLRKCNLGQKEVSFLGSVICKQGCQPDPKNLEGINGMKDPQNVQDVKGLLGMVGFYRRHIEKFAKIALPLTNLTKEEGKFIWKDQCEVAFHKLKEALMSTPILVKADVGKPLTMTTDASNYAVGAVLRQVQAEGELGVIGYFMKKVNQAEVNYSATGKEA